MCYPRYLTTLKYLKEVGHQLHCDSFGAEKKNAAQGKVSHTLLSSK